MKQLLVATTNQGKLREIKRIFIDLPYQIISLSQSKIESGFEVDEVGKTFRDNAIIKAKTYGDKASLLTIAEDSGLEVDALNGRPGVESRRFGKDDEERVAKLLKLLEGTSEAERTARFICVSAIYDPQTNQIQTTQGVVEGTIAFWKKGSGGFGYDPVFIPKEGDGKTFSELGLSFKTTVSHRARAFEQAKQLLRK